MGGGAFQLLLPAGRGRVALRHNVLCQQHRHSGFVQLSGGSGGGGGGDSVTKVLDACSRLVLVLSKFLVC